ncbi:guanylate kinase [Caulobacter sp. S45]|uniref:guanylate kinase n=1 Tax=Caulobacter sp. S45 TaxID=1641861 RepID=UPI001575F52C|nr:guanylate kinase [Caulobacter sp. S45]
MLVLSSPSGAGKTSLSRRLVADHAELKLSVSCTTRSPRPGEQEGREYAFVGRPAFDAMVAEAAFLEWAEVHDHRYGTPRAPVLAALEAGRDVLFDIDWQGAEQVAAGAPADVVRVFVLPPTMADLRRRLFARAQDGAEVIERRLARAPGEIARWSAYDYVLVNDDFDQAYADLAHIYHAERLKRARNPWLSGFVTGLLESAEP